MYMHLKYFTIQKFGWFKRSNRFGYKGEKQTCTDDNLTKKKTRIEIHQKEKSNFSLFFVYSTHSNILSDALAFFWHYCALILCINCNLSVFTYILMFYSIHKLFFFYNEIGAFLHAILSISFSFKLDLILYVRV